MNHEFPHDHVHEHDSDHSHEHDHSHGEGMAHGHVHTQTKNVLNRLARAAGHLESVRRMVEDGRDCADVLIQLAAVRSALNSTAKVIMKDHMEHCLYDAANDGDHEAMDALCRAIDQFID